jgi:hypothetical protein
MRKKFPRHSEKEILPAGNEIVPSGKEFLPSDEEILLFENHSWLAGKYFFPSGVQRLPFGKLFHVAGRKIQLSAAAPCRAHHK